MRTRRTYERNCPCCGILLVYEYSCRNAWHNAEKKNSLCGKCAQKKRTLENPERMKGEKNPFYGKHHSEETKKKIAKADKSYLTNPEYLKKMSQAFSGKNNPMYGRSFFSVWVEKYGEEEAIKRQLEYSEKKSKKYSGKGNPMYGKPSPMGCGNGWKGWYKGIFFRSLRELSYMVQLDTNGAIWRSAETSEFRIPYIDVLGKQRSYRSDFFVNNNTLVEIKPKKLITSKNILLKTAAAEAFCKINGWIFLILDVKILPHSDIAKLKEQSVVKFMGIYECKFEEYVKEHSNDITK